MEVGDGDPPAIRAQGGMVRNRSVDFLRQYPRQVLGKPLPVRMKSSAKRLQGVLVGAAARPGYPGMPKTSNALVKICDIPIRFNLEEMFLAAPSHEPHCLSVARRRRKYLMGGPDKRRVFAVQGEAASDQIVQDNGRLGGEICIPGRIPAGSAPDN